MPKIYLVEPNTWWKLSRFSKDNKFLNPKRKHNNKNDKYVICLCGLYMANYTFPPKKLKDYYVQYYTELDAYSCLHLGCRGWVLDNNCVVVLRRDFEKVISNLPKSGKCCICGEETSLLFDAAPFRGYCCEKCNCEVVDKTKAALYFKDGIILKTDKTIETVEVRDHETWGKFRTMTLRDCSKILGYDKADEIDEAPWCWIDNGFAYSLIGFGGDWEEEDSLPINELSGLWTHDEDVFNGDLLILPNVVLETNYEDDYEEEE